jgi:hypothetical protein
MGNEHGAWPGAAPASAADGMRSSASGLSLSNKIVAGFLLAVVLAYGALFIHFSPLALQDNPNHLARAAILADLIYRHGQIYGHAFSYHFLAIPYVLGDLLIATLAYLVGPAAAWIVWTLLAFLALPGALLVYSRAKRATPTATLLLLLLSIYFSTDAFFVLGFLSFRLGVAFVFLGLGVVELLRQRWTGPRFVLCLRGVPGGRSGCHGVLEGGDPEDVAYPTGGLFAFATHRRVRLALPGRIRIPRAP